MSGEYFISGAQAISACHFAFFSVPEEQMRVKIIESVQIDGVAGSFTDQR